MFTLIQIPKHGDSVFTTGGGEGAIGGDRDSVDVTGVAVMVGFQFEF